MQSLIVAGMEISPLWRIQLKSIVALNINMKQLPSVYNLVILKICLFINSGPNNLNRVPYLDLASILNIHMS